MLILVLVFASFCAVDVSGNDLKATQVAYRQYLNTYNKHWSSSEVASRLGLYLKAKKIVDKRNAKKDGYTFELNKFADMTADEKKMFTGLNHTSSARPGTPAPKRLSAPRTIDWRDTGAVTGVKNQGYCGSCWTFSAVGVIEGVYQITTGIQQVFSEQELLDCVYFRDGCVGGWPSECLSHIKKTQRLAGDNDLKYRENSIGGPCDVSSIPNSLSAAVVTSTIHHPKTDIGLRDGIAGSPVSVALYSGYMWYYKEGIFSDTTCSTWLDHAVTAVGYTENAWIVKNSWGTDWGRKGYIYMDRGINNQCGINLEVFSVTMERSACDLRTEFRCESGQCIPLSSKCDGTAQCSDGTDEWDLYCELVDVCTADEWKCGTGDCVPKKYRCDGWFYDCFDASDEANC